MSNPITPTAHDDGPGDAPMSAARDPDVSALDLDAPRAADELIGRTVTINRPRAELYAFWRDFSNLALFMENIESVQVLDARRSHWIVSAPGDQRVEWDSLVTEDVPGELIGWRSAEDSQITHGGRIEFREAQGGRGTEVSVTIVYDPPAGALGKLIAKLFQKEPKIQSRRDLRRFKQLMETGEVSTAQINSNRPDSH